MVLHRDQLTILMSASARTSELVLQEKRAKVKNARGKGKGKREKKNDTAKWKGTVEDTR